MAANPQGPSQAVSAGKNAAAGASTAAAAAAQSAAAAEAAATAAATAAADARNSNSVVNKPQSAHDATPAEGVELKSLQPGVCKGPSKPNGSPVESSSPCAAVAGVCTTSGAAASGDEGPEAVVCSSPCNEAVEDSGRLLLLLKEKLLQQGDREKKRSPQGRPALAVEFVGMLVAAATMVLMLVVLCLYQILVEAVAGYSAPHWKQFYGGFNAAVFYFVSAVPVAVNTPVLALVLQLLLLHFYLLWNHMTTFDYITMRVEEEVEKKNPRVKHRPCVEWIIIDKKRLRRAKRKGRASQAADISQCGSVIVDGPHGSQLMDNPNAEKEVCTNKDQPAANKSLAREQQQQQQQQQPNEATGAQALMTSV
ncbi:zinc finger DHHC domain-containing protein, putative [Eimeria acervulina]|uniref:Zinc finger DHHC domain-containing protein, putative n=1 Tax=Eimeria acervulina TaxID=5801 RepID=U6G725_EIMAC|nr:zinc finger DHHC domain-containing protein, putative [Eimeria acervulina]CDI76021.1 zinc finger DHHC domain-containing protein, putative [Eimeria acervulina]